MRVKRLLIIFIVLTVAVLGFSGCRAPARASTSATEEQQKLDFRLLDVEGNEVSLSDFYGKVVLVNFFGTWCAPCRREMPDFVEVYSTYRDKNVEFIGIAVNSDLEAVKDFIDEFGIEFPILMDGSLESVSAKAGIRAIPSTIIFDEQLNALVGFTGLLTKAQLVDILEDALNQ